MAQIDSALRAQSIHVDREHLSIQGPAKLVFGGVSTKEDAAAVENARKAGKLPPDAKLVVREGAPTHAMIQKGTTVALASIAALGKGAAKPWTVSDVVWTSGGKAK